MANDLMDKTINIITTEQYDFLTATVLNTVTIVLVTVTYSIIGPVSRKENTSRRRQTHQQ